MNGVEKSKRLRSSIIELEKNQTSPKEPISIQTYIDNSLQTFHQRFSVYSKRVQSRLKFNKYIDTHRACERLANEICLSEYKKPLIVIGSTRME